MLNKVLNKILNNVDYEIRKLPHVTIRSPNLGQYIGPHRGNINVNWLETAYTTHLLKAFLLGLIEYPHTNNGTLPTLKRSQEELAFFTVGSYEAWCEQNIDGLWIKYEDAESFVFAFQDEGDAAAFKMFI